MINDKNVKNHPNLIKRGGSVVNTDKEAYLAALARREKEKTIDDFMTRTKELEDKVNSIDDKLNAILSLLKEK